MLKKKTIISKDYIYKIYQKYSNELLSLTKKIRNRYEIINKKYRATFSDFEGEILYCLIRDRKPETFYEISPDCGYSSIYITSAFKKNNLGRILSFEIESYKFSQKTEEVIKKNLEGFNYKNHDIIIGDVTKTHKIHNNPDMVLIDSCHEKWFAKWYLKELFPKIKDLIFLQDIVFFDRMEYSGEAEETLKFLNNKNYLSLGLLEKEKKFRQLNNSFPRRRSFQSNSVIYSHKNIEKFKPEYNDITKNNFFGLGISDSEIYQIENLIENEPLRQNIHRTYLRLYQVTKKKVYIEKAISNAIFNYSVTEKPFLETQFFLFRHLHIVYLLKTIAFKPFKFFNLINMTFIALVNKLRKF